MSQLNKHNKHFFLILFSVFALGLYLGRMSFLWSDSIPNIYKKTKTYKILRLIDLINKHYVDKVNIDSVVNIVLTEVLQDLDPHSVYFTQGEYRSVNYEVEGHFRGIGITYNVSFLDTPVVMRVFPGSPAQEGGIIPGDMLLKVNDKSVVGISTDDVVSLFATAEKFKIRIKRTSADTSFSLTLKKRELSLPSVFGWKTGDSVCYVRITSFGKATYREFLDLVERCDRRTVEGIILDLRDNSGGMLAISNDILQEFFPRGTLLFYLKSKQKIKEKFYSQKDGRFVDIPLVVLINQNTASASELIAGAVQDNDRGVVIGTRSFGKGLVQSEYRFADGSVVRLTTSKYYTPSGRCLQRPYSSYYLRERGFGDSLSVDSSQIYHTKNGRIIFGGGGVTPDIWIEDTLYQNTVGGMLLSIKALVGYGTDIHRLGTIRQVEAFADSLNGEVMPFYQVFSMKYNLIESRFGQDSAYRFFNRYSPVYHKALEVLGNKQLYNSILTKTAQSDD